MTHGVFTSCPPLGHGLERRTSATWIARRTQGISSSRVGTINSPAGRDLLPQRRSLEVITKSGVNPSRFFQNLADDGQAVFHRGHRTGLPSGNFLFHCMGSRPSSAKAWNKKWRNVPRSGNIIHAFLVRLMTDDGFQTGLSNFSIRGVP